MEILDDFRKDETLQDCVAQQLTISDDCSGSASNGDDGEESADDSTSQRVF